MQLGVKAVKSKVHIKSKCSQGQAKSSATAVKFSEVKYKCSQLCKCNQAQSSPSVVKSGAVVQV